MVIMSGRPVKRFEWLDELTGTKDDREPPTNLQATDRGVALVLFAHMNDGGRCSPGKDTIAAGAGVTLRPADESINRLERLGWLIVTRSKGRHPNVYQAATPNPAGTNPVADSRDERDEPRGNPAATPLPAAPEAVEAVEASSNRQAEAKDPSLPANINNPETPGPLADSILTELGRLGQAA